MADDVALRNRRSRAHRAGDHSLCRPERCEHVRPDGLVKVSPKVQSGLVNAYQSALETAGRLDSPEGELVITLAQKLVQQDHTGAAVAALSKELRAAYDAATKDAVRMGDALDELAARRERKLA